MVEQAVILAIGSTNYISQLTYNRPHTMLPALGKPLVIRAMDRLRRAGIRRFTVVIGRDEGAIAAHLNRSWFVDVVVDFVLRMEGETLADLLIRIGAHCTGHFLLTTYETFTHQSLPNRLLHHAAEVDVDLIVGGVNELTSTSIQPSLVFLDKRHIVTNPNFHHTPFYLTPFALCGPNFIDLLARTPAMRQKHDLLSLFTAYSEYGQPTHAVDSPWCLNVRTDLDLLKLNRYLLDEDYDSHVLSELSGTIRIMPPVRIDPQVSVGQGASIGPYTYLESGCSVSREAVVRNAMVLQKAFVAPGAIITDCIVSSQGIIA